MQKGITPIIATILLVLITISIIGFALIFFTRTQQTVGEQAERQALQQGLQFGTKFRIDNVYQNRVYVRNTGSVPIPLSSLGFYVDNQPVQATGPATLDTNTIGEYVLDPSVLPKGSADIRVSGVGGSASGSICYDCFDFSLSAGSIAVTRGSGGTATAAVNLLIGIAHPVSLSVSALPPGAAASLSPPSGNPSFTSTLTVSTSSSTPTGSHVATLTGTGGNITRTTQFALTVNPPSAGFDFSLSNGGSRTVTRGSSTTNTITATLISGTTQSVSYSASGLPSGATASFSPASCNPTCSTTMTITTSSTTPTGTYTITVTGTGGSLTKTTSFALTVSTTAPPPPFTCNFYVSPTGTTGGNGNQGSPWDLQTALDHPASVKPGDTICLRGGTYKGGFISKLTGTAAAPIIVRQYPGERATIDSGSNTFGMEYALFVSGGYTWFWGFEVRASDSVRVVPTWPYGGGSQGIYTYQVPGKGVGTKLINLVVHDNVGTGIGHWVDAKDAEVYGSLVYYNGVDALDSRGHGHGIYTKNNAASPTKWIIDNIVFQGFGYGIHAYSDRGDNMDNYHFEGNIMFNNGELSAVSGFTGNFLLGGSEGIANNDVVVNNYAYYSKLTDGENNIGWARGFTNLDFRNNYFAGGNYALRLSGNIAQTIKNLNGNTFYGNVLGFTSAQYPNNVYYGTTKPTGVKIFVRPNKYEAGRANIAIFNWDLKSSVDVDVSGVLNPGDTYEVRNAQNFFGPPVRTGAYNGSPINIPMTGLTVATPVGNVPVQPKPTTPEFGAFVLLRTGTAPSAGVVYYVAKTGSDSYSCAQAQSEATPKLTINAALNCIGTAEGAGAEKTVVVEAGTYDEWLDNNIPGGTSWSAPFTLKAKPGDTVIIKAPAGAANVIRPARSTTKYVIIDGFILDGTNIYSSVVFITWSGTDLNNAAHHIRIQNSELKNSGSSGILVGPQGYGGFNEFINLNIHDSGDTDFDHGIYIHSHNNLIENSRIWRNAGRGIQLHQDGGLGTDNNTIRNNKIYDNARVGQRGSGIIINAGSNNIAYNNIIWGNNDGIIVGVSGSGRYIYNNKVYNNMLWNNSAGPATGTPNCIQVFPNSIAASIKNNICWQNKADINDGGSGTILSNNLFTDPKFVNTAAPDFHLQSTSPAIDAGAAIPEVTKDFDGVPRPQGSAYDIGAYEFVT